MAYTYDDFLKVMKSKGLNESQFSQYDLDMAKQNPEFGIGMAEYKKQYTDSTNSGDRGLINADADALRTKYGNYTGGATGLGYTPGGPTPSSFKAEAAPTYKSKTPSSFTPQAAPTYTPEAAFVNPYTTPTYKPEPAYNNQYSGKQSQLLNDITSYKPFEFNADTNPQMQAYTKQYSREGNRAMQDTLGSAAAATGGIPSTAAVSAAGQANDYYMGQLGDKLPQIYESEYNKYLGDFNMANQKLGAVNQQEGIDYSRYWDGKNFNWDKYLSEVDQSNNNRDFSYKQYTDNKNFNYDKYLSDVDQSNNTRDFGYKQFTDDKTFDYGTYLNDLSQSNTNREFGYRQHTDNITNAQNVDNTAYGRTLDAAAAKTNAATGAAATKQNAFDNQYKIDTFNADAKTTKFNQMMDKFQSLQYADKEIAGVLGVAEGTPYGGALTQLAVDQAKANIALTQANTTDAYASAANRGKTSGAGADGATDAQINDAWNRVKAGNGTGSDFAYLMDAGFSDKQLGSGGSSGGGDNGDAVTLAMAAFDAGKGTQADWDTLIAAGFTAQELTDNGYAVNGAATPAGGTTPTGAGSGDWMSLYDPASLKKYGIISEAYLDMVTRDDGPYDVEEDAKTGLLKIVRKGS